MRSITSKTILAVSLSSLLVACGGGGSDSSSSIKIPEAPISDVTGTFKDAYQTGVFYNNETAPQSYGYNGRHCAQNANARYYETANALIYGAAHLPESDFKQAAKWVEGGFIAATNSMKMTKTEYFENRRKRSPDILKWIFRYSAESITKERMLQERHYIWYEQIAIENYQGEGYDYLVNSLLDMVYVSGGVLRSYRDGFVDYLPDNYLDLSQDGKLNAILTAISEIAEAEKSLPVTSDWITNIDLPHDFDLWLERETFAALEEKVDTPLENYIYGEFKRLNKSQQHAFLEHALVKLGERGYGNLTIDDITYQDKLYVCLSENTSDIGWGEGTNLGITFTAPSVYSRTNAEQIIVHELIHTLQSTYTSSPEVFSFIPRWMSEGQAVFLSGQNVAKADDHHNYDPLSVIWFSDEYGDAGEAYEHYGLAYSYIHKNSGIENVLQFYKQLDTVYDDIRWNSELLLSPTFEHNFGLYFKDHSGQDLSFNRFKQDYSTLMSSWN